MKNYASPQKIEIPIIIYLHTAQIWLRKLGYVYKDVYKNVFMDKNKQFDIVED